MPEIEDISGERLTGRGRDILILTDREKKHAIQLSKGKYQGWYMMPIEDYMELRTAYVHEIWKGANHGI